MRTGYAFLAALSLSLTQCASANFYYLKDKWVGADFYQGWNWETGNDPTHGHVNYVGLDDARNKNLTSAIGDKFVMRADDWSIVGPSARGRDSVRITSQTAYDEAIFVLDLAHMPTGCSTWPAFWTLSQRGPWPVGGEIDIIEGVNLGTHNQATLHTSPGCTMPPNGRQQTGTTLSSNCDANAKFNQGCGVGFPENVPSYGSPFNLNGGGYYAMLKSRDSGIQIWFWPRNSPHTPPEIALGGTRGGEPLIANPLDTWGPPYASFPLDPNYCHYDTFFNAHQIVFDLTLCGDWAGNVWAQSGCGIDTCENYVNNNPTAFRDAYWEINGLHVYTPDPSCQ